LHHPEEIASEIEAAGFVETRVLPIEGPGWLLQDFEAQWNVAASRDIILEVARRTETQTSLLGASSHLMAVARKPGT
jgi:hypothetical protein